MRRKVVTLAVTIKAKPRVQSQRGLAGIVLAVVGNQRLATLPDDVTAGIVGDPGKTVVVANVAAQRNRRVGQITAAFAQVPDSAAFVCAQHVH